MQGRSTRTWQGVAGMLVTVQMLLCAYAGSSGTVERSRSGRAGPLRAKMAAVSTRKFHRNSSGLELPSISSIFFGQRRQIRPP